MKKSTITSLLLAAALILVSGFSQADQQYTVVSGDSLTKIGKRFNVSYQDIMSANNLRNTKIYTGQNLIIPTNGNSASRHTYPNTTTNERYSAPAIPGYSDTSPYRPAETPDTGGYSAPAYKAPIPRTSPSRGVSVPANASLQTYTVQLGDSVRSVSKKFGVTFWDLRKENDIFFSRISPGQVLKIPPKSNGLFGMF